MYVQAVNSNESILTSDRYNPYDWKHSNLDILSFKLGLYVEDKINPLTDKSESSTISKERVFDTAALLAEYILTHTRNIFNTELPDEVYLSKSKLGKIINRTPKSVYEGLKVLEKVGAIEIEMIWGGHSGNYLYPVENKLKELKNKGYSSYKKELDNYFKFLCKIERI